MEEHDRDRRRCRLGRKRHIGASACNNHRDRQANQFDRQRRQPLGLIFSETVHDRHVLALGITGELEAQTKSAQSVRQRVGQPTVEESDHRHRRLLPARRERPRRRRAAKQCDELAPVH